MAATLTKRPKQPILDRWWHELWLPSCALIYLIICLFDFIIAPCYTAYINQTTLTMVISKLDPKDIGTFADNLTKSLSVNHQWNPITLMGGGLFHLAFGSLLTAGATTRGLAKKEEVKGFYGSLNGAPVDPPSIPKV